MLTIIEGKTGTMLFALPALTSRSMEREMTLATREDLLDWVCEALKNNGGKAKIPVVAKHIWDNHQQELRSSGDLFYTWQYDMRWATYKLRKQGKMTTKGEWALKY